MKLIATMVAASMVIAVAGADVKPDLVSSGKRVDLKKALMPEGTTVMLFIQDTSVMEQQFLEDLQKALPSGQKLALKLVRITSLEAEAAKQFDVASTPTAITFDRWAKEIGRSSTPDEIKAAVRKGTLMGRIKWIDEDDPKAAEIYGPQLRPGRMLPGIVKTYSLRPEAFSIFNTMSKIHFTDGFLPRRDHEVIAAYVSGLNKCKF